MVVDFELEIHMVHRRSNEDNWRNISDDFSLQKQHVLKIYLSLTFLLLSNEKNRDVSFSFDVKFKVVFVGRLSERMGKKDVRRNDFLAIF